MCIEPLPLSFPFLSFHVPSIPTPRSPLACAMPVVDFYLVLLRLSVLAQTPRGSEPERNTPYCVTIVIHDHSPVSVPASKMLPMKARPNPLPSVRQCRRASPVALAAIARNVYNQGECQNLGLFYYMQDMVVIRLCEGNKGEGQKKQGGCIRQGPCTALSWR